MTTHTVADFMTPAPVVLEATDTLQDAARALAEHDIGAVLVRDGERLAGIVTDRDLVVRGLAAGKGHDAPVLEVTSTFVVAVGPEESVATAVQVMREEAVRRVPVVRDGDPVGILSIGDLAVALDPDSGLADISGAEPNR
ncbi:CBS domain-containing protein [Promicromonospora sukumoe]|uniref:CBS domain-containing protein n=1 Tax=Promicromonospora sukumoe TaxID=88382 RepID=UPI00035D7C40|nr:CBS domain-containing protein [Promicromonospora sukumoe]